MEVIQQLRERAVNALGQAKQTVAVRKYFAYARGFYAALERMTDLSDPTKPIRVIFGGRPIASDLARAAFDRQAPSFVLFWEPHPERADLSQTDVKTIKGLGNFLCSRRVQPQFTIVFADSTAASRQIINYTYLRRVEKLFRDVMGDRVSFVRLSDLYAEHDLGPVPPPLDPAELKTTALQFWFRQQKLQRDEGLHYAALRRQEQPLIQTLLGERGVLLSFAHPLERVLLPEIPKQIFIRTVSGRGFQNLAPWHTQATVIETIRR